MSRKTRKLAAANATRQQPASQPAPASRPVRARYDAALTTDENREHWSYADGLSAGAALDPTTRQILRNRCRYEAANNCYFNGMVWSLANDCIGGGPVLSLPGVDKAAATQVETLWWDWAVAIGLPEKLRLLRMAKARDGEGFATFVNGRHAHPIRLSLRLYEADQIANPYWNGSRSNRDHDGVILDDFGEVIGYSVLNSHPGESEQRAGAVTIPAADMIHVLHRERAGQVRGLPEFTPGLPLCAMLRRTTLAIIAAYETAASIAAIIETAQVPGDPEELEPLDLIELHRRYAMTLPRGWKANQMKAEHPTTTYKMFKREILGEMGRPFDMAFFRAAGDSSGYNFSSVKMDNRGYGKRIRIERSMFEYNVLGPLFRRWWQEAQLLEGLLPASVRSLRTPPAAVWRWDGDEFIDPLKERQADAIALQTHQTTLAEIYGRQNKDWEAELRQRGREIQLMDELGLIRDIQPETFGMPEEESGEEEEATDAVFAEETFA